MTWLKLPDDIDLFHSSVRDHPELNVAIRKAQFDVFNHYLQDGEIKLKGYEADPDQADSMLVSHVKQTIADVVSFRLRNYDQQDGIQSKRSGNRSITFSQSATWDALPQRWTKYLVDFDNRKALYHV